MKWASSTPSLSHWHRNRPSIAAGWTGVISMTGEEQMIMPPTCWETCRGKPAISSASSTSCCQTGDSSFTRYSGRWVNSSISERAKPSVRFASRSISGAGRPSTLPMSRTALRTR